MTNNITKLAIIVLCTLMAFFAFSLVMETRIASASAPSGLTASQRVATSTQVGPGNATKVFSASPNCASRLIRTQGTDIYILFADPTNGDLASTTLSGVASFTQAASTTVSYDGGLYGCGAVYIKSPAASTTLTVADFL